MLLSRSLDLLETRPSQTSQGCICSWAHVDALLKEKYSANFEPERYSGGKLQVIFPIFGAGKAIPVREP